MAVSHGERTLGAEWIALVLLLTGDALGESKGGKFALPQPSRYFGAMVAYLMLAGLALTGEKSAKLASTLGGVALVAIALAPPNVGQPIGPGNRPLVVRFLAWLSAMMKAGPVRPGSITQSGGAGTTGGLPGGQGEANIALQQAIADMNTICSAQPNSAACKAAQQRVANVQSVAQGASQ